MLIKPINEEAEAIALFLSKNLDFFWLDSADQSGFSLMAFDSTEVKNFHSDSDPLEFQNFLNTAVHSNFKSEKILS